MEETLVIVKPDAVRRGLIGEILSRIERKGLRVAEMRTMRIDRALADEHYGEHREKPFFDELVGFITSGDVVVARVVGEGAVSVVRELMGPTDPAQARPGTIRGDFGLLITENLIHGSDSPETAKREIDLFFG
jgi:nucleoside-diphosphate kinase